MESTTPPVDHQTAPPAPPPGPRPVGDDGFFHSVRRAGVVRTHDRWIGGVCGGIARRLGLDPLLVRGLVAATVLLGGAGLVLYGAAWALLPEEVDGRIHLEETIRGRFDAALLGAIAFVVIGLNRGDGWFGWWDRRVGWVDGVLWVAALAAVVAVVVAAARHRRGARAAAAGAPAGPPWSGSAPTPGGGPDGARGGGVPHPGYGAVPLTHAAAVGAPPGVPGVPGATGTAWGTAPGTTPPPPPPSWSGAPHAPAAPGVHAGPYAPAPAHAYQPRQPSQPRPPRPARPRVQGPGAGAVGAVVGLTLLTLAVLLVLQREGELGGLPVGLTALGIGVVLTGLAIMIAGLRGRSSGVLGLLGVIGIVGAVPIALAPGTAQWLGVVHAPDGFTVSSGETWTPRTAAEAEEGVEVGLGDLRVDLTEIPLGDEVVEVPIRMSAGNLEVVVPDDAAVTGEIALTAGELRWDVDPGSGLGTAAGFSGITGGDHQLYTSAEALDGDVELAVHITAGAGDVRVVEEDR